jgi:thioredoxin-related protein
MTEPRSWFTNFEAAAGEAKRQRKPILLQFERDRCAGCRKLETLTYRDPGVQAELFEWFVPLRLDLRRDRRIRAQYGAVWTPAFYFLDYHGKAYYNLAGYLPPEDFRLVMRLAWAAAYLPKGQYDEVIARLDDGLKLFPDHPRAPGVMLHRAMARYLKTWDTPAFRAEMAELVRRYPDSPEARMWPWDAPPPPTDSD